MATIKFRFEDNSIPEVLAKEVAEGYSILEATEDFDVHLNHNFGVFCVFSLCHIYVLKG